MSAVKPLAAEGFSTSVTLPRPACFDTEHDSNAEPGSGALKAAVCRLTGWPARTSQRASLLLTRI